MRHRDPASLADMSRMTPADRDRTIRIISLITGGLSAAAVAATGVTTALAAQTTHERQEAKAAAHPGASQALAEPSATPSAPSRSTAASRSTGGRTHVVTGKTHSKRGTRATSTADAPVVPKPKPSTHRPAPPPPTTTSGS
jgi:hypothetical protein